MPKLKTSKTAKKRFKSNASGKLFRRKATRAHKLSIKPASRKRAYTREFTINKSDEKRLKKMLRGAK